MKTEAIYGTWPAPTVYKTDHGEFTKERISQSPSTSTFEVTKLSGEWPTDKELLFFCHEATSYFGGTVSKNDNTARVLCYTD